MSDTLLSLDHLVDKRQCMQDWPGRTGLWGVGVPPSGPMDALAFRMANALVGNDADAAGLEIALEGALLPST